MSAFQSTNSAMSWVAKMTRWIPNLKRGRQKHEIDSWLKHLTPHHQHSTGKQHLNRTASVLLPSSLCVKRNQSYHWSSSDIYRKEKTQTTNIKRPPAHPTHACMQKALLLLPGRRTLFVPFSYSNAFSSTTILIHALAFD